MPPEAILPLGVHLDPRYEQQVLEIDGTRARLKISKIQCYGDWNKNWDAQESDCHEVEKDNHLTRFIFKSSEMNFTSKVGFSTWFSQACLIL